MAPRFQLRVKEHFADLRCHDILLKKFEVFKTQDTQKGHFDLTLEIDGKKLYVHKFFLASASEYFGTLLSDRWNDIDNDNVIKIERPGCTYEIFYEFICFIYYGECNINIENVFVLTDMAEYYGIRLLKKDCDYFLSDNIEITNENYEQMEEFVQKYSLNHMSDKLDIFKAYKLLKDVA